MRRVQWGAEGGGRGGLRVGRGWVSSVLQFVFPGSLGEVEANHLAF